MVVENGYSNNIDSLVRVLSGGIEWVSTVAFRSLVQKLRRESRMRKLQNLYVYAHILVAIFGQPT